MRRGRMFILYLLSTAGLIASLFLLGDALLFMEGMMIVGLILLTNIIVVICHLHQ